MPRWPLPQGLATALALAPGRHSQRHHYNNDRGGFVTPRVGDITGAERPRPRALGGGARAHPAGRGRFVRGAEDVLRSHRHRPPRMCRNVYPINLSPDGPHCRRVRFGYNEFSRSLPSNIQYRRTRRQSQTPKAGGVAVRGPSSPRVRPVSDRLCTLWRFTIHTCDVREIRVYTLQFSQVCYSEATPDTQPLKLAGELRCT